MSVGAQTGPTLRFKLETNGALTVTWPVPQLHPLAPDLLPSYRAETASELGKWAPIDSLVTGADVAGGTARVQLAGLSNAPATFLRVRALLDFPGRMLVKRTLTDGAWDGADFSGADLFGANLSGSTMSNSILKAADLRNATLQEIDARGADLTLARLEGANCNSANFAGAKLLFVDLSDTDLSFAQLDGADLRGAVLQTVISSYTRFHNCVIDDLTVMDPAIRTIWEMVNNRAAGRNFNQGNLSVTDLSGANLTNCLFRLADFSGADLQQTDLSGADLTSANMRFVDFRGTKIDARTLMSSKWRLVWDIINNPRSNRVHSNTDLSQGFWVNVDLDHADIHGTQFTTGVMFDPVLNTVNALGTTFSGVQFNGGDLRNGDFRNAIFSNAQFDGVDMTGAKTNGAIFTGAIFTHTTMPDGSIRN